MFYTYAHYKPLNNELFYIGKGTKNRYLSKSNRNKHWINIVNKHGFVSKILSWWETEEEALEHEKLLIASLKDIGVSLCNATNGGEGISGFKHSEETKDDMSKSRKGIHFRKTYDISQDTRLKMSVAQTGRKHSQEVRKKISEANTGQNNAMYGKPSPRRKKIICLTNNKVYDCITDAANELKVNAPKITLVCQGTRNSTGGYVFKYVND
jgi:group I intron endonuclease